MLTKIFRFLGVPTKYDFPKKTRDVVLLELKTILEEKKHQVECLKAFVEKHKNNNVRIVGRINKESHEEIYGIPKYDFGSDKSRQIGITLIMNVCDDLYKHCKFYGITEYEGFKIESNAANNPNS